MIKLKQAYKRGLLRAASHCTIHTLQRPIGFISCLSWRSAAHFTGEAVVRPHDAGNNSGGFSRRVEG